jgi:hypothetical protein
MEVEGWHDSMETFERQVAGGFKRCNVLERRANFSVDENVSVSRLRTEPGGKIDHRPDRAVVAAPLEPDRPERRVSMGDADAEAERMSGRAPSGGQLRYPS